MLVAKEGESELSIGRGSSKEALEAKGDRRKGEEEEEGKEGGGEGRTRRLTSALGIC